MHVLRTETLDALLRSAVDAGFLRIGQIQIRPVGEGFHLCHIEDVHCEDLERFRDPDAAPSLALTDDAGAYRPLKTAPNLRHGWRLEVASLRDLRLALDFFYPAALGNWRARLVQKLQPVPFRATVNRQTGMYRITGKITDEQAEELVGLVCRKGCLRNILWSVSPETPSPSPTLPDKEIPLLCGEGCNLLVAAARKIVKGIPLDQVE